MMMRRLRLALAIACASQLISCSSLQIVIPQPQPAGAADTPRRPETSDLRIVQVEYGRHARFVQCDDLCPAPTPKSAWGATPALAVQSAVVSANSADVKDRVLLLFGTNQTQLTHAHMSTLRALRAAVASADSIEVLGRTDNLGPGSTNERIARERADSVYRFLRAEIPGLEGKLTSDAAGNCCYVASNDSVESRRKNRRVEVVLTSRGSRKEPTP